MAAGNETEIGTCELRWGSEIQTSDNDLPYRRVGHEEIDRIRQPGRRYYESELFRLRAELTLTRTANDIAHAEIDLRQAVDIARHQKAKSLELRAAMSLGRLWQKQGKSTQAHQLISGV